MRQEAALDSGAEEGRRIWVIDVLIGVLAAKCDRRGFDTTIVEYTVDL